MFREGLQIGSYKLIKKLGRGGFAQVWLAEKESQFLKKKVAVKLPHVALLDYDTIKREAMLWEQASGHPNVLPIIDADIYDDQVVIVSEYADGGSLAEKIEKTGKLTVKQAVEMTIGILNGLEFLHSKRIIHRDIKPQNILLQGDTPRLTDFGISRVVGNVSVDSIAVGTAAYMSPEAFDGRRNVLTDIWSVGVVLYELLKGSLPFPQENFSDRMMAIHSAEIMPLSLDVPFKLREIVRKALAKNPGDRYQTSAAMRNELQIVWSELSQMHNAKTEIYHVPPEPIQSDQPVYFKPLADVTPFNMEESQVTIQIPKFQPNQSQPHFLTPEVHKKPSRSPFIGGALIALLAFGVLAVGAGIVWMNTARKSTVETQTNKVEENSNSSVSKETTAASLGSDNSNPTNTTPAANQAKVNKPLANTVASSNTIQSNRIRNRVSENTFYPNTYTTSNMAVNTSRSSTLKTPTANINNPGSGGDGYRNRNQ
ncbi:hypothetical protein BH10ACI1_BH10ACI1_21100 [soil metagenome]